MVNSISYQSGRNDAWNQHLDMIIELPTMHRGSWASRARDRATSNVWRTITAPSWHLRVDQLSPIFSSAQTRGWSLCDTPTFPDDEARSRFSITLHLGRLVRWIFAFSERERERERSLSFSRGEKHLASGWTSINPWNLRFTNFWSFLTLFWRCLTFLRTSFHSNSRV